LISRIITLLGPFHVTARSTVLFNFAIIQFPYILDQRIAVSIVFCTHHV